MKNFSSASTVLKWLLLALVAIAASNFYYQFALSPLLDSLPERVFSLVYCFFIFYILIYVLFYKSILPRLKLFSAKGQTAWIIGSFLAGSLLVFAIPVKSPLFFNDGRLTISASGGKNPLSEGNEVWFTLSSSDGQTIPLSEFTQDGNWSLLKGAIFSAGDQHRIISWEGIFTRPLTLTFTMHPWSGIVRVDWQGISEEFDLYADPGNALTLPLSTGETPESLIITRLYYASAAMVFGFLILFIGLLLSNAKLRRGGSEDSYTQPWVHYSFVIVLTWTLYLLSFWPGVMSVDSLSQWRQIATGNLVNDHPAAHTLILLAATKIWSSPAAISLIQIIVLGLVAGYGFSLFERLGSPKILCWAACLIFAISPVNSVFVITLWKDILYSTAILWLSLLILSLILSDRKKSPSWLFMVALIVASLMVGLFRHNGLPVVLATWISIVVITRNKWKMLAGFGTLIFMFWLIQGPVYRHFSVQDTGISSGVIIHHLAPYVVEGHTLTDGEKEILNRIRPIQSGWDYDCYVVNPTTNNPEYRQDMARKYSREVAKILLDVVVRNPMPEIKHKLCASSLVWLIDASANAGYNYTSELYYMNLDGYDGTVEYIPQNEFGLEEHSLLPQLQKPLFEFFYKSSLRPNKAWFWGSAFYLYLGVFITILSWVRTKDNRILLILVPILVQSIFLFMVNVAQDFRYQYAVYLFGLSSIPLLSVPKRD